MKKIIYFLLLILFSCGKNENISTELISTFDKLKLNWPKELLDKFKNVNEKESDAYLFYFYFNHYGPTFPS